MDFRTRFESINRSFAYARNYHLILRLANRESSLTNSIGQSTVASLRVPKSVPKGPEKKSFEQVSSQRIENHFNRLLRGT